MLAGCLWALIIWSVIQLFWPPGAHARLPAFAACNAHARGGGAATCVLACANPPPHTRTLITSRHCAGPVGATIFSLLGALLFSAYIVFDTNLILTRVSLDDYIWASVQLYLDVINLFLYILRLVGESQRSN